MPMTWFAQMRRSDHSMRPPAPAATIAFGSPNACNLCHTNQTPQWADAKVREWRTRDYQAPILALGRLIQAARSNDWSQLPAMLEYLARPSAEEMVSASLLRLLVDCPDPRAVAAARERLESDRSPLVRAAATELLARHRHDPRVRAALIQGCRNEYRLVRVRSAIALSGAVGPRDPPEEREAWDRAIAEYRASLDCRPDDWASHYNLGNLHLDQGDARAAAAAFAAAVRIAPEQPMPWVNGAIAHARAGDLATSEQWLRRALTADPTNAVANFNLALAVAERGRLDEAETLLRRALASDPRMAEAAYNLGVLLGQRSPAQALEWTARAVRFRPADPRYRWTHAFYLHRAGRSAEARAELEDLMNRRPPYPEAVLLLGELYELEGRAADARRVYERALQDLELPSAAAQAVRARLRAMQ